MLHGCYHNEEILKKAGTIDKTVVSCSLAVITHISWYLFARRAQRKKQGKIRVRNSYIAIKEKIRNFSTGYPATKLILYVATATDHWMLSRLTQEENMGVPFVITSQPHKIYYLWDDNNIIGDKEDREHWCWNKEASSCHDLPRWKFKLRR